MDKQSDVSVDIISKLINEECGGFGFFQLRLCLLCCCGYFAVGSELFSMVMTQIAVSSQFGISSTQFAWLPFSANLASFLAAIIVGAVVDKFGRTWAFQGCILLSAIFGIACAFAPSFPWLVVFRSVVGFGLGGMTVIDYIVLVEVCPEKWKNVACQTVFVSGCIGVVYIGLLGLVDWTSIPVDSWRSMLFCGAFPLLLTGLLRVFIPVDTPKYLVTVGRVDEAYSLLETMARTNKQAEPFSVSLDDFRSLTTLECFSKREDRGRLSDALEVPGTKSLACVWIIQSLVYWGLTLILPLFFTLANIDSTTGLLCMGFAELPGVAIATFVSQRTSRTISLMMCFALALFGSSFTGLSFIMNWPTAVLIASVCLFYMFLIPVWGILFIHTPESYPVKLRGVAVGFHHMCKSLPSLAAPFIGSAIMQSSFRDYTMFLWSGCILCGLALGYHMHRSQASIGLSSPKECRV
jgi:putative MFS transporter